MSIIGGAAVEPQGNARQIVAAAFRRLVMLAALVWTVVGAATAAQAQTCTVVYGAGGAGTKTLNTLRVQVGVPKQIAVQTNSGNDSPSVACGAPQSTYAARPRFTRDGDSTVLTTGGTFTFTYDDGGKLDFASGAYTYAPAAGAAGQTISTSNHGEVTALGNTAGTLQIGDRANFEFYAGGPTSAGNPPGGLIELQVQVIAPPAISTITPTAGSTLGGTSVTITGSNFTATGNTVTFGGTGATIIAQSTTSITVNTPGHAAGAATVIVTTADGVTATSPTNFTYVTPPTVTALAPLAGPSAGGTGVVITGTNFAGATAVSFGGVAASSFVVNSNTQITAPAPAHAAGPVNITVTTAGGTSAAAPANQYTYTSPITNAVAVGTSPIVTGASSQLTFTLGNPAGNPAVAGIATSITLPANLVFKNPANLTNTCGGTAAANAGPGTLTLSGGTLAAGATCTFGAAVTSNTPGTYTIPTGIATSTTTAAGMAGGPGSLVVNAAMPTVTAISPVQGSTAGGSSVTITGTSLTGATAVTINGAAAAITAITATQITATTGAGTAGTGDVVVTTPAGTATLANGYTYLTPPTATSQSVTTAYNTAASITVSGTNATSYAVATAPTHGTLSGTTPNLTYTPVAGYSGPDSFTFTTTNGTGPGAVQSAPATVTITVSAPLPSVTSVAPNQGTTGGGTAITITGSAFTGATAVTVGGASATGVTVISDTQITATTPPGTAGAAAVAVTNATGTSTVNGTFTYVAAPTANGQSVAVAFNTATTITLTGSDPNSPARPLTYAVVAAPAHGTLSGTAPNLTYTPSTGYSGADSFTFTVNNGVSTSTPATVAITVGRGDQAITFTSTTPPGASVGGTYPVAATASSGLPVAFTIDPPASGVCSLSGSTVTFTGVGTCVIDANQPGNASYNAAPQVQQNVAVGAPTVTVNPATVPAPQIGVAYSQTFGATGGVAPYTFAVSGSIPPGLTLSSSGTLSGTPSAGGPFAFTVTATDSSAGTGAPFTGSRQYSTTVQDPTLALTPAEPSTLPGATGGQAYNQMITTTGGTAPYTYAVIAGALPTGLSLSPGGAISGTPIQAGTYTFQIRSTDSSGGTGPYSTAGTGNYALTVAAPAIAIAPPTLPGGAVGQAYSQTLTASGGTAPYSYAVVGGALPAGLTLSTGGVLSGTPAAGGTFNFAVRATDAGGFASNPDKSYSLAIGTPTLSILPATLPGATSNVTYSQTIVASGGTAPYSYAVTAGALPAGITLASSGTLSGRPTTAGSFSFTVTATDSSTGSGPYAVSQSYTLAVSAVTIAIAPATLPAATTRVAYSQTLNASGGVAPYTYAVTAGALPAGITLSASGTLSGTATVAGSFNFTATASDANGNGGGQAYTLAVNAPAIALAPTTLPAAATRVAYSQTLTASGGVAPYTYAVTAGALPAGITLSASGTLSGTANAAGSFTFTVTATDANGNAGAQGYTLTVDAPAIVLAPATLPNAAAGTAYSQAITASGGTAPYSYAITAGALPAGLTLATSGTLAGTPTAGGSFTFTATATDTNGNVASQSYTLTVAAATVTIAPASLPGGASGTAYSQTLTATGGTAPYSYQITAGALPAGLTLSATGTLAGTPTQSGSFTFSATATDSSTGSGPYAGTRSYTLTIAAPALTLAPATLPGASVAAAYSQAISASGGTAPYSYAVTAGALPAGITLSATGTLSGTPSAGGSFTFTVTASDATTTADGGPYTASRSYTLTVAAATVTIAPASLPGGASGTAYSQTLTATGGTAPYSYQVTAGALPAGLTLSATGTLAGTPTQSGSFTFSATATDSSTGSGPYAGTRSYTLTIAAPALTLAPATLPGASVAAAYSQAITASGGTAPYSYAVTAGALPAGITLSATGTLSGTPSAGGSFTFTMTASDATTTADGGPYTASRSYTLTVAAATVTIAPASLPGGTSGTAYSQTLAATGGTAPYSYQVTAGALPAGLTLSATGTLAGTPTQSGSFTFSATATDSSTGSGPYAGTRSYTLTIAAPALTLAPATLPGASVAAAYSQAITASGGTAPYSYAVTAGALPAGITLSATGTLSGTPSAGGSFTFTMTASDATTTADGGPYTASASYTIVVAAPAVTLAPASLPAGNINVAYTQELTATGGTAPYSYAVTAGALPAGLTLSATGTLAGTPTQSGSFTFSATATDSSTGSGPYAGMRSYTLSIAAPPPPATQNAPQQTVAASTASAMQSVSIDLSSLVTGSYTDIQIATQPQHGSVTIAQSGGRFVATFTPAVGYAGADGFGFVAVGQGGRSAEARVSITVAGAVPVAPAVRGSTIAGQPVTVDLTANASGGPFTAARIVGVSQADAVAAELIEGGVANNRTYQLRVTPGGRFSGTATVQYTLSNAFGTSAIATATITVAARPDPTEDANVSAISTAQAESTRRFAQTQTDNFMRRTEQLHGGGAASQRSPFGITVGGLGFAPGASNASRADDSPAQADVVSLKMEHATAVRGAEMAAGRYAPAGAAAMLASRDGLQAPRGQGALPGTTRNTGADATGTDPDADPAAGRKVGSVAIWSGGAITVGTRDATSRRARLSVTSSGLSAGADLKLADTLTIGAGGGYGHDRSRIGRDDTARVDGDSYVGALYGSYAPTDGIFIDVVAGAGHLGFDTRRLVAANGAITYGNRDGSMIFGSLAGGIDRTTDRYTLSIYGRANVLSANLDAYRESGAGLYDLAFAHRDLTSLSSTLGGRGSLIMGALTPRVRIEWRHEFSDTGIQALDYADLQGYTYRLRGDGWLRDAVSAEIGAGFEGAGWQFGVDVGGELGSGARAATVKATIGKEF